MMSDEEPAADLKVSQGRHRCLVCGLIMVALLSIAAIVVPLVVDTCDECPKQGTPKQEVPSNPLLPPVLPPVTAPPVAPPKPPSTPAAESPTNTTRPPNSSPTDNNDSPSQAPTSERLGQFIEAFLIPLSGAEPFENHSSPQFRAGVFMAEEDLIGPTLSTVEELEDRYALATFYYAMEGENWFACKQGDTACPEGSAWLDPAVSHCDWNSINCNAEGRVTDIYFTTTDGNGLFGEIPPEITILTELKNFVAVNNLISGPFPSGFSDMRNVEQVILIDNRLAGSIPEGFLSNSPLALLLLSNNELEGPIPLSLGGIATLSQLFLDGNKVTGTIPDFSATPNLGSLNLANNELSGSIPSSLYDVTSIERLYLQGNPNLEGTLAAAIGNLVALTDIRLAGTQVGGDIPEELLTLPNLEEIDFTGAAFSGVLSESFGGLAATLKRLLLSDNELSGPVPAAFDTLTRLNSLELQVNALTGSISTAICSRRGEGFNDLKVLTTDCEEVACDCCSNCF